MPTLSLLLTLVVATPIAAVFQARAFPALKTGAKVFFHSMPNDFDTFLKAAIRKKKVPIVVVENREQAEFEIKGTSESQKAGEAPRSERQPPP